MSNQASTSDIGAEIQACKIKLYSNSSLQEPLHVEFSTRALGRKI